ncbi:MAG: hypothetical protein AAF402_13085 [Pseudomonadota bacterium]
MKFLKKVGLFAALSVCCATNPVHASVCGVNLSVGVEVSAVAPLFRVTNESEEWEIESLTFDLAPAVSELIFDIADAGRFEIVNLPEPSQVRLAQTMTSPDMQQLQIDFDPFSSNDVFMFRIALSDALSVEDGFRPQVLDLEGAGLYFTVTRGDAVEVLVLNFDSAGVAAAETESCTDTTG